jgi:hypothetical protein
MYAGAYLRGAVRNAESTLLLGSSELVTGVAYVHRPDTS